MVVLNNVASLSLYDHTNAIFYIVVTGSFQIALMHNRPGLPSKLVVNSLVYIPVKLRALQLMNVDIILCLTPTLCTDHSAQ